MPTVHDELSKPSLPPKAVLVLDNCPAHPDAEELISDDGNIFAHFLPPNITSLIQPLDQGVLIALKRRYKRKLLHRLIIEDENGSSIIDFLKSVNMKVVVEMIAESWEEISASTLRKSWKKIVAMQGADSQSDHEPSSREQDGDNDKFVHEFQVLGVNLHEDDVCTWLENDSNDSGF